MTLDHGDASFPYHRLGWQVDVKDGRLELVTGTGVDALEVPRAAGVLASHWWMYTEGYADDVRKLPSMPPPGEAMAVITAGRRAFFLTETGACPWTAEDPVVSRASSRPGQAAIRWHSAASRIPYPPGRTDDGHQATWAHLPTHRMRLAAPAVLLHLLAAAVAAFRHGPHMLTLPGDVLAIPALGGGTAAVEAAPPMASGPYPTVPFGFRSDP